MDNFTSQPVSGSSLDSATREKLAPMPVPLAHDEPASFVPPPESFFGRNRLFVAIFVVALVVIGILAFFALRKPGTPSEPKVSVDVIVPAEVPSSGEAIIKTVITNNDSSAVSSGELELVFPTGAVFISSTPPAENLSGNLYKIPELSAGANITVLTKLKFEGGVGDEPRVQARLSYKLSGITADFAKQAEGYTKLVAAGVSLDIQGPSTTTNAQVVSYTIHYINQSSDAFEQARIKFIAPQGFQFAQSNPAPSQGSDTWDLGQLAPGAQGDIVVNGAFVSSTPGQSTTVTAQLQVPDKNGTFYTQAEGRFSTAISSQPLVVSQTLQTTSEGGALIAAPGDTLQYKISYQNNATTAARGVRIIFTVDSNTADLASLQAEGAAISGNTVTWSAASKPELEVVNPNESGSVSVTVKVKDVPVKDRTINPDLITNVKIRADEYDTFLAGNKLQVKLATVFTMIPQVVYSDGQKPPRVGQATTYKVTVDLSNSTNDITNATVSLFVATGGNTFDAQSITGAEKQNVTYDSSTGKLVWRINTLKAHTGDFSPKRTLQFTVKLIPSSAQIGRPVRLIKDIQFTGIDSSTQKNVTATESELTTNDAASGSSDGIVTQ